MTNQFLQDIDFRNKDWYKNLGKNTRLAAGEFNRPNLVQLDQSRATRAGLGTQRAAEFVSKQGFNPLLAGGFAGLGAAMNGGGLGEIVGSGSGGAGAAALAGRLAAPLANMGTMGKLAAAGISIAAPMLGAALGGGIGKGLDQRYGAAASAGADASANRLLNPTNSLGAIIDASTGTIDKQSQNYLNFLQRARANEFDMQKRGLNEIAIPLLNHQSNLRAKMLPLDVAARLAQQTNQNVASMYNTGIAGTSDLARQIAAQPVFGQVMI